MIEIRKLSNEDNFKNLIYLSREFFQEYQAYHKDFFALDELKDEHIIDYFSSFCDRTTRQAFIALDEGRIVGYITVYVKEQADYWQVKRLGEISGLMVQKEHRQQGIGRRLLDRAKDFFAAQGVKYYTVYTAVENRTALDFYRQNGLAPLYTTMVGEI
jgi:ribosomal protein S18 acetylase RimI-like enzyme